jgi:hypothetical protein
VRLKAELDHGVLAPIYDTIRQIKKNLPPGVRGMAF